MDMRAPALGRSSFTAAPQASPSRSRWDSIASPRTFGHGGVGSSYCWADPDSGVSFAYLTNSRVPDPWHSARLDVISNTAHAAILNHG